MAFYAPGLRTIIAIKSLVYEEAAMFQSFVICKKYTVLLCAYLHAHKGLLTSNKVKLEQ